MRCTKCGTESTTGRKFCAACGSPLSRRCPKCGAENAPSSAFCEDCGGALARPKASATTNSSQTASAAPSIRVIPEQPDAPARSDGERKTVTALFADIKGSTELEQDLDPEEARAIVDPALKLMIEAVHRYDGYVVQSTGDGIFALFGAPAAHEDHAQRALYAALRMQDELRRYSGKLVAEGGNPLQCRVGVNTGEVVVRSISTGGTRTEYTPIGHTANLASRMQAVAPVGSIAVAEPTRKLCEGYFVLKPLGPTKVRGLSEPVNVYEVAGLGPLRTRLQRAAGRGLTKFVGREREIQALKYAAERANGGRGQIVAAMAEAGAGKSRLYFEFKATSQSGWMVLETFSVSHGKASAYLPLIDLLHGYFKIAGEDDERTRREKIAGKIAILDRTLEDTLPYLFSLLGIAEGDDPLAQMDGQIKKRRTLDVIKRILLRESLNQPLMVIFEDLHWIDEETQVFLNLLADSIATAKILLLVNYRPEYSHSWNSKTYYTQLRLDPLGKESAQEMLSALIGAAAIARSVTEEGKLGEQPGAAEDAGLAALKRLIIEKTEGNPFFMEETVQVLLDEGALVRNGVVKLSKPVGEMKIPPTVQAILAARIDRLPQDAKDLLQALAVIGREFPLSLIRAVVPNSDDETSRLLDELQIGEFIYEQPALGDTEYTFKHALTQEVSYNSMLSERRKHLHEGIAAALEQLYATSTDDHLDQLAHHYGRSGNVPKALEFHERAGRRAVQRSAYAEAMRNFTSALELLQRIPPNAERNQRELTLQTSIGPVLMATKGWAAPETERAILRAQQLAETGGSAAQRFSLLMGLFGVSFVGGRLSAARDRLKQIRDFTSQHPEPAFVMETCHLDWSLALSAGELESAQRYVEDGLALYEAQLRSASLPLYAAHHPGVCAHAWGAIVFWLRGYPDTAQRHANRSVSLAHEIGDAPSVAYALCTRAQVHQIMRGAQPALETAEAAVAMAEKHGFPFFLSYGGIVKGWALAQLGRAAEGIVQIREGLASAAAAGSGLWLTYNLAQLAEACGKAGRIDRGLTTAGEALDLVHQNGERWWEAEIHRLRGELLLVAQSDSAEARGCFELAIQIARKQAAKSLELRATLSLARLLASLGHQRDERRAMLAEIYGWFTEGFDTADLKDAKALLDELGE